MSGVYDAEPMDCIFCKIVAREIPAKVLDEDEHTLAFHDVRGVAPTHVLVVPKRHLVGVRAAEEKDTELLGRVMLAGQRVAEKLGLGESGYRFVVNQGEHGGQSVFHLHLHLLGGRAMSWPPG